MGKKSLRIEEDLHELIEDVQVQRMKKKGERPSKEKVVGDALSKLVGEERRKDKTSELDKLFGL